jgi:chromosome partitioning protein
MTKIISTISTKGGAGKTTLAMLLGGEYAVQNQSVLFVDGDERQNLAEWWQRCASKDNVPVGIELVSALTQKAIQQTVDDNADKFDGIIMDAPGKDTVISNAMIRNSDIVLTPIQPNQDELRASSEVAEQIAAVADAIGKTIRQANVTTRVSLVGRSLEAYRLIRPFIQNVADAGYDALLLETELTERNCYRDIRNGYGTLQMLELTESVIKGRAEVARLFTEVETLLTNDVKGVVHG